MKLIVLLGISECVGFIQVTNTNSDWLKFNAAFAFMYSLLRSLRGIMLWFVYIPFGNVIGKYKQVHHNKIEFTQSRSKCASSGLTSVMTKQAVVMSSSSSVHGAWEHKCEVILCSYEVNINYPS